MLAHGPKNIALTGFMAVGKTVVGRKLARRLAWRFVDLDRSIEHAEGMPVKEIFSRKGEAYFRRIEKQQLRKILRQERQVISTGGGAVIDEDNLRLLRETTLLICLKARPETVLKRAGGGKKRPLLDVGDREARINRLLIDREAAYARAHASVDTDDLSPDEVVERIIQVFQA